MQERVQRKGHFPILLVGMLIGTLWRFLKKLKIELPYDPAIPLLGTYLENMKISMGKDTCTPLFIAELFFKFYLYLFNTKIILYWGIADSQCCDSFR